MKRLTGQNREQLFLTIEELVFSKPPIDAASLARLQQGDGAGAENAFDQALSIPAQEHRYYIYRELEKLYIPSRRSAALTALFRRAATDRLLTQKQRGEYLRKTRIVK